MASYVHRVSRAGLRIMHFNKNAQNLIALLSLAVVTSAPLCAFGREKVKLAANQPTRIQRAPYQGGVSKTGIRIPVFDNEYPQERRQGSLDSGAYDNGSMDAGVADTSPLGGGVYDRAPRFSGATVDIGGTPMTTSAQLDVLSSRNVAILVDRSSSMREKDCPGHISRWRWCQEQAELFSNQTAGVLNERFTLALFAHHYDIYPSVTLDQMRRLFEHNKPGLGTHPEEALRDILDAYFRGEMGQKPLAIAVVSDGEPNDPEKVVDVIRDATWQMKSPDQVSITFLQVGHGDDGSDILREFDQQMRRHGAKYDIVSHRNFYELQRLGLLGSLVASIKATMPAVVKAPAKPKAKPRPAAKPPLRPAMRYR